MIPIDSNSALPTIDINFRISAGPGAGKTFWLVGHIRSVLRGSTRLGKSGKIACITYTNVGVQTIVARLGHCADRVEVTSIHSFLYNHVVKPYLHFIAKDFGVDFERVDGHTDSTLSNYSFLKEWKTRSRQMRITDDAALSDAFRDLRWKFDKNGKLEVNTRYPHKINGYGISKFSYELYKTMAWGRGVIHHDDVLFLSYQIFQTHPFVLTVLVSKFPYLFVDEFQDSNPIQVAIVNLLGKRGALVGIIGDVAQSIYGFQGAKPKQFLEFSLPGFVDYVMSGNRRSSNQIVNLLNATRKDITQKPTRDVDMELPIIFVGRRDLAYMASKSACAPEYVYSLSRDNLTSNAMRRGSGSLVADRGLLSSLKMADSNDARRRFLVACVKSVELARQYNFKAAVDEIKRVQKKNSEQKKENGTAIALLLKLLAAHVEFSTMNLLDFSNFLRDNFYPEAAKVTTGKAKDFYLKTTYEAVALSVNIVEDVSLHRTVHKAKGDEFNNILLVLSEGSNFDFILNPDLLSSTEKGEEQRVNYVGISRAKNRLFISVPELSVENRLSLAHFFHIEDV
jgi:DNA helicase-2/ATP-dependent DNA helicase PcrA